MNREVLRNLLEKVKIGEETIDGALDRLKTLPYENMGFARVDHHRSLRHGFPEVIFGQGKTPEQVASIAQNIYKKHGRFLATRISAETFSLVREALPGAVYHETGRCVTAGNHGGLAQVPGAPGILLVTAGTADIPVAEEAAVTLGFLGYGADKVYDAGVAGLHRLLDCREQIGLASVIIVVAGMDGALPSVVGGLVDKPVIAVPTSVGYGSSFEGLAALLTMLNSCAPGVGVVNIDNGFGAAVLAASIMGLGED